MRVLLAAELGALAAIDPFALGDKADAVGLVVDLVDLAIEARRPEAVDDVVGRDFDADGFPNRDVDFVRRQKTLADVVCFIFDFPSPLAPGYFDVYGGLRLSKYRALREIA
jgi:hypothetical protein